MAEADPKIEAAGGSAEAAPDYAALAGEAPAAAAAVAARAKLIAKADDLEAIGKAVEDAASVSGGIWLSYLFFLFYLGVAVGGVTHRDLFLENPVKLPFLNVELPLVAFFFLAPILFLIVHAYTLMHFVLLAKKARNFHAALLQQFPDSPDVREGWRRQLPSNIFVQILAGPRDIREGWLGNILRMIAWVTLVSGPIPLLLLFQAQFLPYHHEGVTWLHRIVVAFDVGLLWFLWPDIIGSAEDDEAKRKPFVWTKPFAWRKTAIAGTLVALLLSFTVAVFPGERHVQMLWEIPFIPRTVSVLKKAEKTPDQALRNVSLPTTASGLPKLELESKWELTSLYKILFDGDIDGTHERRDSLFSHSLVVPGIDIIDHAKFDKPEKFDEVTRTASFRGRDLNGAIFSGADLRKADFTGAKLRGAQLDHTRLDQSKFECGSQGFSPGVAKYDLQCANLKGAWLFEAQLQGASFKGALLHGASLARAHLQGASLDAAQLEGASLNEAQLQGASLVGTHLQGAWLGSAQLQGASLFNAQLQGASLDFAKLQGASLDSANIQGVALIAEQLQGASLDLASVWRAKIDRDTLPATYVARVKTLELNDQDFAEMKQQIETLVPQGYARDAAIKRIALLDPKVQHNVEDGMRARWEEIQKHPPNEASLKKVIAAQLVVAGCAAYGAPWAIRGLASNRRMATVGVETRALISQFLDEKSCPGARGLSDVDKGSLHEVLNAAPSQ